MSYRNLRRPHTGQAVRPAAHFAVGDRVVIVGAPGSYGYNGRAGTVIGVDGAAVDVTVDDPPDDIVCTRFFCEELAPMPGAA